MSVPTLPDDEPGDLAAISDAIRCEIGKAYLEAPQAAPKFADWYATYEITRLGESSVSVGADPLEWLIPAKLDKLVLGANAGVGAKSSRNGKAKFSVKLAEGDPDACARVSSQNKIKLDATKLKIHEWLEQVAIAKTEPNSFSYSVSLDVTESAGLTSKIADGSFNSESGLSGSYKTTRTVDFAFATNPSTTPLQVYVTNLTGGSQKRKPLVGTRSEAVKPTGSSTIPQRVLDLNNDSLLQLQLDRSKLRLDQ
ncbi:hypothetical protein [Rhizobium rhizogenes]|jgi:hypothetical protein|uniref:hypothetical protein n=1 Tax=Rhizobium rhizogenes TaxID=359 RepID=UPI001F18391C|nr:hypothetical protein [Rhizobium rhizogenes]